ncbi:MAG: serine hydrolase, partial [Acidimicrobiales bacterium]
SLAGNAPAAWIFDLDAHPTIHADLEQLSSLLDRLMVIGRAADPDASLSISLSVGPYVIDVNGDQPFSSASAAKLYWTVAAVGVAGAEPVEDLAAAVFMSSDNSAAGRLIDVAGVDEINRFTERLGMESTYLSVWAFDRGRFASDRAERGSSNTTSANDLTLFLDKLRYVELLGPETTARVLAWMMLTPDNVGGPTGYGGALADRLPSHVAARTMHKAGWLPPNCCSDPEQVIIAGGIVPLPDGATFSIAVAAAGGSDYAAQVEWVGQVTCSVYSTIVDERSCDYSEPTDESS